MLTEMLGTDEEHVGKWLTNNKPRKGWELVDVVDLEDVLAQCEWCRTRIRYVHIIRHAEVTEWSRVGCICCGHLIGDYRTPKLREKALREFAQRKSAWVRSPRWCQSANGNWYRKDQGKLHVLVYVDKRLGLWKVKVGDIWGQKTFQHLADAKLAALRGVLWFKSQSQLA